MSAERAGFLRIVVNALGIKILSAVAGFVLAVVLGRKLGTSGTGVFYLALTIITVASTIGRTGLDNTIVRFVAAFRERADYNGLKNAVILSLIIGLGASAALSCCVFFLAPTIAGWAFDNSAAVSTLRWMSISVFFMSAYTLLANVLKGLQKTVHFMATLSLIAPATTAIGVLVLSGPLGMDGAAIAHIFGTIVAASISVYWVISSWDHTTKLNDSTESAPSRLYIINILQSSIPLLWVSVAQLVTSWSSTFFLGIFATDDDAGVFGSALRVSMLVGIAGVAVNSIAAPRFSAAWARNDKVKLQQTAKLAGRLLLAFGLVAAIPLLLFPGTILKLFGDGFADGKIELQILILGQLINVVTGSAANLLMMTGHESRLRTVNIASSAMAVFAGLILIPLYGAMGAAIATSVAVATQNLFAAWYVTRYVNISPFAIWEIKR